MGVCTGAIPERSPRPGTPVAVSLLLVLLLIALWAAAPAQAGVARGLCVVELDHALDDPALRAATIAEVAERLDASWVRIVVSWPRLEPAKGQYAEAYLATLDDTVRELRANGVDLVMTFLRTPSWASDSSFWSAPPANLPVGYDPRYPVRADALADMRETARFLAARYAGLVKAWECWNEPNLWGYIYPQRTVGDEYFGARTYLGYLKAFSAGVRLGDPAALVVAGSTAPVGSNDAYRTSPGRFAAFLAAAGAGSSFDVYSHHPYVPGGSLNKAPDRPPNDPSSTVTLYNLSQLLRLFPAKPFYLTEYGYNTSASAAWGGMAVTKVQQAAYLRKAYAYAARYPQVKNLFWYLVRDAHSPGRPADTGVYTGLRETTGTRKPSWFAFARGNRLSISAPRFAHIGSRVRVSGRLKNREGGLRGQALLLQARPYRGGGGWRTIRDTRTGSDGAYSFGLRPATSRVYRVVWRGVMTSATRSVRVY